jgi:hypothetical protein
MTVDEMKEAIDDLKKSGESEEDILKVLYLMYTKDEFDLETLRALVGLLGYEFTDEFESMSDEDKKTKGWERDDKPAEGVDKEDVEDAKECKKEEGCDGMSKDDDEDDDKKAARLFGFGDKND